MRGWLPWIAAIATIVLVNKLFRIIGDMIDIQMWIEYDEPQYRYDRYSEWESLGSFTCYAITTTIIGIMLAFRVMFATCYHFLNWKNDNDFKKTYAQIDIIFIPLLTGVSVYTITWIVISLASQGREIGLPALVFGVLKIAAFFGVTWVTILWLKQRFASMEETTNSSER